MFFLWWTDSCITTDETEIHKHLPARTGVQFWILPMKLFPSVAMHLNINLPNRTAGCRSCQIHDEPSPIVSPFTPSRWRREGAEGGCKLHIKRHKNVFPIKLICSRLFMFHESKGRHFYDCIGLTVHAGKNHLLSYQREGWERLLNCIEILPNVRERSTVRKIDQLWCHSNIVRCPMISELLATYFHSILNCF